MTCARSIRVRGVVQGVGFRPFVFRLAHANALAGWVTNELDGVNIYLEGSESGLEAFLLGLETDAPTAARIAEVHVQPATHAGFSEFTIRESKQNGRPSVRISPDLPVCADCLAEMGDPENRRYRYPYINCTNCGPRYTVIESLPYDRARTTMKRWPLDAFCETQYLNPADRRFHAQPVACPCCGPHYRLQFGEDSVHRHDTSIESAVHLQDGEDSVHGDEASIESAVQFLQQGKILAIKGIGGYHLACDAQNRESVRRLRDRKYRKEKPFAVMVQTLKAAREVANLNAESEALLTSVARPIVLAPSAIEFPGIAPDNREIGLMLPYTPIHYLLFEAGAPEVLVMTSANRSSEPIAYDDRDARERLTGLADAFLVGERPIARRVDDSVARAGILGPMILRRSRGYAPGAVATLPYDRPILAVGADLKNTVTLVVAGQAFVSQHIGDLDHYEAFEAFQQTIEDLIGMYDVSWDDVLLVHDLHPQYASTLHALGLGCRQRRAVQHHRAHIASVLAEREAWHTRIAGVSFDGTGYGDDGSIWGGEFFVGSMAEGFERSLHLREAVLPGGDAAARHPVQSAAGFLSQIGGLPNLADAPFHFPSRYQHALQLIDKGVRTFETTSVGRLFDCCAALLGFTRAVSFEGQAAMWLEHLAQTTDTSRAYPFPLNDRLLDFRPLLAAVVEDRLSGRTVSEIARAFHISVAVGLSDAVKGICRDRDVNIAVLSGGVFQNELLLAKVKTLLDAAHIEIWTNAAVPPNDGGISLGQAALAAFGHGGVSNA